MYDIKLIRSEDEINSVNQIIQKIDSLNVSVATNDIEELKKIIKEYRSIAENARVQLQTFATSTINSEVNEKAKELLQRENTWLAAGMAQITFFNNLLLGFGVGYLAYVLKGFDFSDYIIKYPGNWADTFLYWSPMLMALSVFVGLCCGFNRILDFIHTKRIVVLKRQLHLKMYALDDDYNEYLYKHDKKEYIPKEFKVFGTSFKWLFKPFEVPFYWIFKPKFYDVMESEFDLKDGKYKVQTNIDLLVNLSGRMGEMTRLLIKVQWIFFLLSFILYIFSLFG